MTLEAQGRLGTEYGALVASLFDAIVEVGGHELVARLFGARRRHAMALIRGRLDALELRDAPLTERARAVAGWHEEHGFAADVTDARGLRVCLHNCPIVRMAVATPAVFDSELRMMADVLDADVERSR